MIPNIFISSTIEDLQHLRDSVRDLILEIGYNPIMSDYGDIGYLPSQSAEDSCYIALKDCQLAIIIIGKRYGSLSKNGLSITQNEFQTARASKIPVIFLVNEELLSFKKIHDANPTNDVLFPGVENGIKIFSFIEEFSNYKINNGIVKYSSVQDAKYNLKKQFAHFIGDLLRKQFDPMQSEIKDILSEITTLRHHLLKDEKEKSRRFSLAYRYFLDNEFSNIEGILKQISGTLEAAVVDFLDNKNLESYFMNHGVEVTIMTTEELRKRLQFESRESAFKSGINLVSYSEIQNQINRSPIMGAKQKIDINLKEPEDNVYQYGVGKKSYWSNINTYQIIEAYYNYLKKMIDSNK